MAFVFYDTETTGTNTSFDQILQFAAIKTDADLNEIDRFECRSRLLPYVVPSPGAIKVTKISVQQFTDPSLPSHYEMLLSIREKLMAWSPSVFIGHNSLGFDEHLLRQALYKTLHPPYLTNTNNNCRSDSMKIVQAISIFSLNALNIPTDAKGNSIFKLDQLAPANGFSHEGAHEAMADAEATLHLCRLASEHAPNIWSNFMQFGNKAAVIEFIKEESLFIFSEFFRRKGISWVVTGIGLNPSMNTDMLVFNLSVDPKDLEDLSEDELEEKILSQPKPIRILKTNSSPIILSLDDAPDYMKSYELDRKELERRAKYLHGNTKLKDKLISIFMGTRKIKEPSDHVEDQIYDSFPSWEDQDQMETFHKIDWADREYHLSKIKDKRLKKLGMRLIYSEKPEVLSKNNRLKLDKSFARRVLEADGKVPWLTLPQAINQTEELIEQSDGNELKLLKELHNYLKQKSEEAKSLLA